MKRLAARGVARAPARPFPAGQDYVLAARPGLAEPAETRGKDWLVAEIGVILEKARA